MTLESKTIEECNAKSALCEDESKEEEEEERIRIFERNDRKLAAYTWWKRLGHPSKKAMLRKCRKGDMKSADLDTEDVELLPWTPGGFVVNVPVMMAWMSEIESSSSHTRESSKSVKEEILTTSAAKIVDDDATSITSFVSFTTVTESVSAQQVDESRVSVSERSFHDEFIIDMELNSGGFSTVYRASTKANPMELYAVKVFERTGSSEKDKKIAVEAEILRQLEEIPNVINLTDLYTSDDKTYMVQELAKGGDLFESLEAYGAYEEASAISIVRTILEAVHTMHTKFHIVHRDIKLENILSRNTYDETDVVLCDFGSARYLPKSIDQGLVSLCGTTIKFAAPELLQRKEYRQEVDIWSIGCVLFSLLGGYHAFDGDTYQEISAQIVMGDYGDFEDDEIWDDITDDAKDVIRQMLTVDRYQRCSAWQAFQHRWFQKSDTNGNLHTKEEHRDDVDFKDVSKRVSSLNLRRSFNSPSADSSQRTFNTRAA